LDEGLITPHSTKKKRRSLLRNKNEYEILVGIPEGRNHVEELGVGVKIILK
jgi:hypothetical protein